MKNPLSDLVLFTEFKPDLPDLGNSQRIFNVLSNGEGYKPLKSLQESSGAANARIQGAFSFIDSGNLPRTFAGDVSSLYRLDSVTLTPLNSTYSTPDDGLWAMVNYGDLVIATNYADNIQSFSIGSSTSFGNLAGSPPKAKYLAIVNEFVMVANTFDGIDGAVPYRTRWSALGNPEGWAISAATLADQQDLPGDGGECTGLVGSQNYAAVFQRNAIWRADFVGFPNIFTFEKKVSNHGCRAPASIATYDNLIYHWGEDGFKIFDGTRSVPIGARRIDKFFKESLDFQFVHRITGAIDPINNIYMVAYPDTSAMDGAPNSLIIYNWLDDRWTIGNEAVEYLFTALSRGYTLEELDSINASLDALPFSLDSSVWAGGAAYLAAFSQAHKLAAFEGPNLAATIDTQEAQLNPDGRARISSVLPLVDLASTTVALGSRNVQAGTVLFTGDAPLEITGEASFNSDARFHRGRIKVPAGEVWNDAIGVKFRARKTGQN